MKFILLVISIGLVGVVLYLGYQLDKKDEQNKRKEKYSKKDDLYNNDVEHRVSSLYKSQKHNKKTSESIKDKIKAKLEDERNQREKKKEKELEKKLNKIKIREEIDKSSIDIDDEIIENNDGSWEVIDQEYRKENQVVEPDEIEESIIPGYELKTNQETVVIRKEEKLEKKEDFEETTVVPVEELEEKITKNSKEFEPNQILDRFKNILHTEEYEEEEDEDLIELQKAISEANASIKRFKKSEKSQERETSPKKESANNVKKFTRKKEKVEKIEKPAKRFTRKKVEKKAEPKKTKKVATKAKTKAKAEPKKRGRKPKSGSSLKKAKK